MQLRYPAWLLKEATVHSCLRPCPVHLLGSASDAVAAALAAGSVAGMLCHRREAAEMANAETVGEEAAEPGSGSSSPRSGGDALVSGAVTAVCLVVTSQGGAPSPSPAAAAMLRVLRRRVPGLAAITAASGCLLDDEWLALSRADAIVLDLIDMDISGAELAAAAVGQAEEAAIAAAHRQLASSGLLELLWQRFWAGCLLVGVGQGCALLGQGPASEAHPVAAPPVLPWYRLRAGGGAHGWATLHATLAPCAGGSGEPGGSLPAVGVLGGGVWLADSTRGHAEMLAAPSRDALVALAAWSSQAGNQPEARGLEEAGEEHGFVAELVRAA